MNEYEARRNARLVSQRLELKKLLGAATFSNPIWNRNLLRHTIEREGVEGMSTKAEKQRTCRSALGSVPLQRSARKSWPRLCTLKIYFRRQQEERGWEAKVSVLLYGFLCFFVYLNLQFRTFFFTAMSLLLLLQLSIPSILFVHVFCWWILVILLHSLLFDVT
jgi:hypothetical protein